MIAILYPLKMTKNLYEAYSAIYEISADKAIEAAKKAEKTRAEKAKAGDTEGAKKAIGQNKKFFNYAKGKRQQENAPKKPTGPMANKPSPDPTSSYPGTPQIMKQGKMIKNSYEPEGKYRAEWETLKLLEKEDYRETFDTWLTDLAEEGYDIERWTDEELVEAFINENNLWGSSDMVMEALLEEEEYELEEAKDKKGKGSGKKDACYHKVKARYDVWPSAYASGALVKCRKKGAKNWGNSSKKEEVDYSLDEIYQGKHGQTEKQYQDSRSDAGKMISGDSKMSGAKYTHGRRVSDGGAGPQPAGGSKKPQAQGRMDSGSRADLQFRKVALKKKEAMKNEEFIDETLGSVVSGLGKAAVRTGIKVGGKTGGKIVKNVIKHGGQELKNQAIQTAGDAAAAAVRKGGEKVRKQLPQDDTNVNEMAMANPVSQSNQRQQLQKAKQAQIAKRALVNKLIKKDNKQDTKLQQKVAQIQMSSFSNWRDELDSLDENRMTAYTAGAGEGSPASRPTVSKKVADRAMRQYDTFAFKGRKTGGKDNKEYNKKVLKDKKFNQNTTGRGQPVRYRDSYEKDRVDVKQSKLTQGTGSFKDLGKKK